MSVGTIPANGLASLWSARTVAVIGASDRPGALGRLPVEYLHRYGFAGDVYPIRPDGAPVLGLTSYSSIQACPRPVELAMVMVAAERVALAIDDCAAAGVPVAIVCSSGFAEIGGEGARLQADVVARARAGGVRVVGPNCIGAVAVQSGLVASFSPLFTGEHTALVPGTLGFVSQSGALGYGAVSLAFERGLGFGWVVNTGNEADVTAAEVMAELAADSACTGILGYIESLGDLDGLRRLAAIGKPVAVLKSGRSDGGQRAAASHTGALAGGDRIVDAALRQFGFVRVDDVDELLDVGDAFTQPRRPAGPRVAVVTTSGGSGILAADAIERHELVLAELSGSTRTSLDAVVPAYGATGNPVDVTAAVMSNAELFDRALDTVVDDESVDILIACFCVLSGSDVDQVVTSLAAAAARSGKPVLAARTGADHLAPDAASALRAAGIPAYSTPARAVRAAAALWYVSQPSRMPRPDQSRAEQGPGPASSELELKRLLAQAGVPTPLGRLAADRADARAAVFEVGGRAVLKAVAPGLAHKTEAGAVVLEVDPERASDVFDRLATLGDEVLVEEMIDAGVEVLIGVAASAFGPVLTIGPGGVLTEIVDDVALRLLPVDADDVRAMLAETRLGRLLAGVRGRPPGDTDALVDAVIRITELTTRWPAGFELDLNPVTVLAAGQGVRVLDAAYSPPGGP